MPGAVCICPVVTGDRDHRTPHFAPNAASRMRRASAAAGFRCGFCCPPQTAMAYNGASPHMGGQPRGAPLYVHDRDMVYRDRRGDRGEPHPYDMEPRAGPPRHGGDGGVDRRPHPLDRDVDGYGYGYGPVASNKPSPPKRESAVQRLKRRVRTLTEANAAMLQDQAQAQHELQHYKDRIVRTEESHRLEIQRLKKEVEYHKRLRQGADQRAFELEDRLMQQMRHTRSFDDNQRLEAEQALLLHSKNTELTNRVKDLEVQVQQLQGLKACLEEQLDAALYEKEQLEEELQQALARGTQHGSYGLSSLKIDEEDGDGLDDDDEEGTEGDQGASEPTSAGEGGKAA